MSGWVDDPDDQRIVNRLDEIKEQLSELIELMKTRPLKNTTEGTVSVSAEEKK